MDFKILKMKKLLYLFPLFFIFSFSEKPPKQPNILWITCEDMSPHLGSYGEKVAKTPNLDQLAKEGVRFTNAFSTAGVCAPSRSALITGCYQTAIGTQNMRTLAPSAVLAKEDYPPSYHSYSAVVPEGVKCFPEYLRKSGYFTTNNVKQDYQFEAPVTVWDENSTKAHWQNRKDKNQPFFSIFNLMVTHESQVWSRNKEPLLVDPKDVDVPPYYPDDSISRKTIARFLTNVMLMDKQVGEILQQLKDDGLYDNTIIFFYSDHGDGMPYVKRELLDRGLRVPLIIKAPFLKANSTDNQMLSFVDFAPTVLSLANVPIPKSIHGQAFLGSQKSISKRKYVYAARDRMDSEYDRVRAVNDGQFTYLRNYMPEKPFYQNIRYRLQNPIMPHLLAMKEKGQLNEKQMNWFKKSKPLEELYDYKNDPHEMNNLVDNPQYTNKLKELRTAHLAWMKKYVDTAEIPEMEMVNLWWNNKETAPETAEPTINFLGKTASISCKTKGASIGYRKSVKDNWIVYDKPFSIQKGDSLYVVAQRIGHLKNEVKRVF
jgi:arylsulfatase A-like enzyme